MVVSGWEDWEFGAPEDGRPMKNWNRSSFALSVSEVGSYCSSGQGSADGWADVGQKRCLPATEPSERPS